MKSIVYSCQRYGVPVNDLWSLPPAYISRAVESRFDIGQVCTAHTILEFVLFALVTLDSLTIEVVFLSLTLILLFSFS